MPSSSPPAGWTVAPLGIDCKLYISDTFASPTRTEITRAINVSQGLSKGKTELLSRMSRWKPKRAGLRECSIDLEYRYTRGTDATFNKLKTSFFSDTPYVFWMLDGAHDIIGSQGLVFPGMVFEFPTDEQLEEGKGYSMNIDFTEYWESSSLIEPQWFVVA